MAGKVNVENYNYNYDYDSGDLILLQYNGTETNVVVPIIEEINNVTLTVFASPANATIVLEATGYEQQGDSITVPYGTIVNYTVSCEGYVTVSDSIELLEDSDLTIILEQIATYTLTINPTPVDAEVVLTAQGYEQQGNSITVQEGTEVRYTVSKKGYKPVSRLINVFENTTLEVELEEIPVDEHIHIQLLRGTTNKNEAYIGREGELTYDIEKKNVRVHDGETPGGKIVSADIDNLTIINDNNDKLQSVAKKNQNRANGATTVIYDWEGTLAQYKAQDIEHTHPDWICYINDDVEGGTSVYTKEEIDRELVHKTGYETIAGNKTFANPITISSGDAQVLQLKGIPTTEGQHLRDIVGIDTEDARIAGIRFEKSATEERKISLYACNENNTNLGGIEVKYDTVNETLKTTAVNPSTESNDTDIVTTNWINQYRTNCLTKIPQDIKLELDNGTLTLKAGSKIYIPDGFESDGVTKKFTSYILREDNLITSIGRGTQIETLCIKVSDGVVSEISDKDTYSGDTTPTVDPSSQYAIWYDTSVNRIKRTTDTGATWTEQNASLPIALINMQDSVITNIDQVFNGFGFIGGLYYCLPGVSGIFPDGRNDDGTMKNSIFTVDNVLTYEVISGTHVDQSIRLQKSVLASGDMVYDEEMNINYVGTRSDPSSKRHFASVGRYSCSDGKIIRFAPDSVCHYIHAGELTSTLIEAIYPVGSIYIGTTESCPISLLIPNSTWELVAADRSLQGSSSSHAANTTINAGLPNINGTFTIGRGNSAKGNLENLSGAFTSDTYTSGGYSTFAQDGNSPAGNKRAIFNASDSNSIYGSSTTVQPPAYVVNVWRRTS